LIETAVFIQLSRLPQPLHCLGRNIRRRANHLPRPPVPPARGGNPGRRRRFVRTAATAWLPRLSIVYHLTSPVFIWSTANRSTAAQIAKGSMLVVCMVLVKEIIFSGGEIPRPPFSPTPRDRPRLLDIEVETGWPGTQ